MQKVLIPTDPSIRSSSHYVSPPIGILTVQILSCKNLIIGDITTSDPFVEVHYLDEIFTTSVKYKNLNPEWEDAYFDLILYDVNSLSLKLIVFDHDFTQEADYLGSLEIILNQENLLTLQQKTEQYSQKLVDGNDGSIQYRLSFKPVIVTSLDKNDTIQSDILFNFPENAFMSDILMSSASPSSSAPTLPILSSTNNTSGRILNGIISVSNLKLELITTNQQSHTTTSTHHSSSNSFYISLYYHTHKKATGVVKGQCEGNNHQILKVSLEGAYSFVIFHQENSILHDDNNHKNNHPPLLTTTTSATSTAPPDSYHDNDHIVVKITHKNKFGSKSICEIYLSVQSLIKQKKNQQLIEKEFQKHIELGTNYTGIVKGNLSFYPLVEKWK